jgi:hypothetical protein
VTNGGFEAGVGAPGENIFDWQVVPIAGARMNLDARESRSGSRSLRLLFEATETINFANVTQLVAIEPQARYRLDFYVRTQDLKSANTLRLVVADPAAPAAALASSQPLALGTSEGWQPVTLEFQTGPQAEAVVLRVERVACDSDLCPLFGKVWYDDFNLQRAGGPAAPARPRD